MVGDVTGQGNGGGLSTQELQTLLLAGQAMSAEQDPARVCRWACDTAASLLGISLAAIALAPTKRNNSTCVYGKIDDAPLPDHVLQELVSLVETEWPPPQNSQNSGRVAVLEKRDLPADLTSLGIERLARIDVRTIHHEFGGLMVGARQPWSLGSHERFVLSTLANGAALALENVRLRREIEEQAERLASVNRTVRSINDRLTALIQASPLAIIGLDRDLKVEIWNPAAEKIFGWSEHEVLHRSYPLVPDENLSAFRASFERALQGKILSGIETIRKRKDGSLVDVGIWAAPLRSPEGAPSGMMAVIADLTERKRAERALQESERRYAELYNKTPVMMHSIDRHGRIINVNDHWLVMLGYQRDEVIGRHSTDFLTEASRRRALEVTLPQFMKSGVARDVEYQMVKKSGEIIDVLLSASAERDDSGNIDHTMAFVIDVTGRKRMDEALRRGEERYRDLYENAPLAYFSVTTGGRIRMVNAHASGLLGYSREQLVGRSIFSLYADTPAGKEKARTLYERFIGGDEPRGEELQMLRADGSTVWIGLTVRAIRDQQGKIVESRSLVMDISERKRAQQELERHADDLARANADLESFSYSVSHDLRAPLRHITGFIELLEKHAADAMDPKSHRYVDVISESAERMGRLIDDLLAFSRTGRTEMSLTTIDLNRLAEEARRECLEEAGDRNILWTIEPLPEIEGDRSLIRLILVNLFSNAVKFSRARAEAEIEVRSEPGSEKDIVLLVRDNGVGFDMKYAPKLFGVFQRLHRSNEFEGTGIGLATVRRIVERHGGRVWAEAALGSGATFYVSLPRSGGERR